MASGTHIEITHQHLEGIVIRGSQITFSLPVAKVHTCFVTKRQFN